MRKSARVIYCLTLYVQRHEREQQSTEAFHQGLRSTKIRGHTTATMVTDPLLAKVDECIATADLNKLAAIIEGNKEEMPGLIAKLKETIVAGERNEDLLANLRARGEALDTLSFLLRHGEVDVIRAACIKITSISLWSSLMPGRLEEEFHKDALLRKRFNRQKAAVALADDFVLRLIFATKLAMDLEQTNAGKFSTEIRSFVSRVCSFFGQLLCQIPTRLYLSILLDDQQLSVFIRKFGMNECADALQHFVHYPLRPSDLECLTTDYEWQAVINSRIAAFQQRAIVDVQSMGQLAVAPFRQFRDREWILEQVLCLPDDARIRLHDLLHVRLCPPDMLADTIHERFAQMCAAAAEEASNGICLPSNLMFLSWPEYRHRWIGIVQSELKVRVQMAIDEAIRKCRPSISDSSIVACSGWSPMAILVDRFSVASVGPADPLAGDAPTSVIGEASFSVSGVSSYIQGQWGGMLTGEPIILLDLSSVMDASDSTESASPSMAFSLSKNKPLPYRIARLASPVKAVEVAGRAEEILEDFASFDPNRTDLLANDDSAAVEMRLAAAKKQRRARASDLRRAQLRLDPLDYHRDTAFYGDKRHFMLIRFRLAADDAEWNGRAVSLLNLYDALVRLKDDHCPIPQCNVLLGIDEPALSKDNAVSNALQHMQDKQWTQEQLSVLKAVPLRTLTIVDGTDLLLVGEIIRRLSSSPNRQERVLVVAQTKACLQLLLRLAPFLQGALLVDWRSPHTSLEPLFSTREALLGRVSALVDLLGVVGDYDVSCASADLFLRGHILPRWDAFEQLLLSSELSHDDLLGLYPFASSSMDELCSIGSKQLSNREGLSSGDGLSEEKEDPRSVATRHYKTHIRPLFEQLARLRPLELLAEDKQLAFAIRSSQVVLATADDIIANYDSVGDDFDVTILLEGESMLEPVAALSIRGQQRLVVFGDLCLPEPCVSPAVALNSGQSFFKRLLRLGIPSLSLATNPSKPDPSTRVTVVNVHGRQSCPTPGFYQNPAEVQAIADYLSSSQAADHGNSKDVVVVATNAGQVELLARRFPSMSVRLLDDELHYGEYCTVLLSMVRTADELGFFYRRFADHRTWHLLFPIPFQAIKVVIFGDATWWAEQGIPLDNLLSTTIQ